MSKSNTKATDLPHELGRGTVNHSHMGALVTSKLFRCKAEKVKKGKGSYTRGRKHKGMEPFQSSLIQCVLKRLFLFA
nr:alternative ribosome rescue factor ArfA [Vibrio coralliirubri]